MGIKNLHRFLKKHNPDIYHTVNISDYKGKTLAVDTNIYLYRYKSIHKDRWVNAFLSLILMFKKHGVHLVFIYDTKAPIEKKVKKDERKQKKKLAEQKIQTIRQDLKEYETTGTVSPLLTSIMDKRSRRVRKLLANHVNDTLDKASIFKEIECLSNQVVSISKHDVSLSKNLLECMGIPFYDSNSEAETLCAHLCCHKIVDAVLSDDTDVLVYGTPIFATKLNLQSETFTEIQYPSILESLKLTEQGFTDLCIMCGTDYNKNIYRVGSEKAYKYIQKHQNLDEITTALPDLDVEVLNYKRVREIFQVPLELSQYNVTNRPPDLKKFELFNSAHNIRINTTRLRLVQNLVEKLVEA